VVIFTDEQEKNLKKIIQMYDLFEKSGLSGKQHN
jgi:hypothetical protein